MAITVSTAVHIKRPKLTRPDKTSPVTPITRGSRLKGVPIIEGTDAKARPQKSPT
jgi:hypothetical protein